jgi:hypothetical protein
MGLTVPGVPGGMGLPLLPPGCGTGRLIGRSGNCRPPGVRAIGPTPGGRGLAVPPGSGEVAPLSEALDAGWFATDPEAGLTGESDGRLDVLEFGVTGLNVLTGPPRLDSCIPDDDDANLLVPDAEIALLLPRLEPRPVMPLADPVNPATGDIFPAATCLSCSWVSLTVPKPLDTVKLPSEFGVALYPLERLIGAAAAPEFDVVGVPLAPLDLVDALAPPGLLIFCVAPGSGRLPSLPIPEMSDPPLLGVLPSVHVEPAQTTAPLTAPRLDVSG